MKSLLAVIALSLSFSALANCTYEYKGKTVPEVVSKRMQEINCAQGAQTAESKNHFVVEAYAYIEMDTKLLISASAGASVKDTVTNLQIGAVTDMVGRASEKNKKKLLIKARDKVLKQVMQRIY